MMAEAHQLSCLANSCPGSGEFVLAFHTSLRALVPGLVVQCLRGRKHQLCTSEAYGCRGAFVSLQNTLVGDKLK